MTFAVHLLTISVVRSHVTEYLLWHNHGAVISVCGPYLHPLKCWYIHHKYVSNWKETIVMSVKTTDSFLYPSAWNNVIKHGLSIHVLKVHIIKLHPDCAFSDLLLKWGIVCATHLQAKQNSFPLCFAQILPICRKESDHLIYTTAFLGVINSTGS